MTITKQLSISIILMATLLMVQTAQAATYYVDRLLPGSDSNVGTTEAAPFLTIAKCVAVAINPGDTCLVKNGTYPEHLQIDRSGTAGNLITFKNYSGHSPIIRCPSLTDPFGQTTFHSASGPPIHHLLVEGFEVTNCYFGFKFDAAEDVVFRGNHVHDTWYSAFSGTGHRVTIDRNHIHHTGDFSYTEPTHTHAVYVTGLNWTITNNLIYDSVLYGIQAAGYILGTYGTSQQPNANFAGWSGLIANNTFAYTNTRGAIVVYDGGTGSGGNNPSIMQGINIKNNIFYENCNLSTCGGASGIDFVGGQGAYGTQIANNVFFASGTGSTAFIHGGTSGSTYVLSGNSINTNPNMANAPSTLAGAPDFRLQAGSVAINFGLDLTSNGVTTDFRGVTRPQGAPFDSGAYKYSGDATLPAAPRDLTVR